MRLAIVLCALFIVPKAADANPSQLLRARVSEALKEMGDRLRGNRLASDGKVKTLRLGIRDGRAYQMLAKLLWPFVVRVGMRPRAERQVLRPALRGIDDLVELSKRTTPTEARLQLDGRNSIRVWHQDRGIEITADRGTSSAERWDIGSASLTRNAFVDGEVLAQKGPIDGFHRDVVGPLRKVQMVRFEASSNDPEHYGEGLIRLLDLKGAIMGTRLGTAADFEAIRSRFGREPTRFEMILMSLF